MLNKKHSNAPKEYFYKLIERLKKYIVAYKTATLTTSKGSKKETQHNRRILL